VTHWLALIGIGAALSFGAGPSPGRSPAFAGPKEYATGAHPVSVVVGDLNGDRRPDLATANYGQGANSVSVLLNSGRGRFRTRRDYATGESPGSAAIADLNGDARPDLAVVNEESDTVSILVNDGRGRFAGRRDYATSRAPFSVAAGDLNSDGNVDLAIANGIVHTVSVLLNSGGGEFRPRVNYRTARRPQQVVIGDLNGDRRLDLATGNRSDTVSVLMGRGDGSFAESVDYRAGSGPRAIALGDLNGDRRPDLATANTNFDVYTVSVLINRGNGSFRPKRDYRAGNGPWSIAIGDVNGDGRRDIAAAIVGGNGISLFLNRSGGTFRARRDFRAGQEPASVAIGDLNGDGRPELVTANARASSVSVLANGTGSCIAPNVVGKTLSAAQRAIVGAGCRVGAIRRAYSTRVPADRVISGHPSPGRVLPRGTKIGIVVSRGRRQ
jgi:FG-GAP-like repeat/PASTA domain/FG-GAP repeat